MSLWPGLLAWSTSYSDGTRPSEFAVMDDKRKEWLKKALENGLNGKIEDQNVRLKQALTSLSEARLESEALYAIDEIDACVDFPDCSENFARIGGIVIAVKFLKTSIFSCLRSRFLSVLSLFLANNPSVQLAAFAGGLLATLLELSAETTDPELRLRTVGALGALIRGVPTLESGSLEAGGRGLLNNLAEGSPDDGKIREKCQSLLEHLE